MKSISVHPLSLALGCGVAVILGLSMSAQQISAQRIQLLSSQEKEILGHMSIVYLDNGLGGLAKTIRIEGVNVQVVNGLGATNGYPPDPNSISAAVVKVNNVGNLIVGYNEMGNPDGDFRTGSHNVVVGHGNTYFRFGGIVAGLDNTTSAPYASVSGGTLNTSSVSYSSIGGGRGNSASSNYCWVGGGSGNHADGSYSTVSGGLQHTCSGAYDWAAGTLWENQ